MSHKTDFSPPFFLTYLCSEWLENELLADRKGPSGSAVNHELDFAQLSTTSTTNVLVTIAMQKHKWTLTGLEWRAIKPAIPSTAPGNSKRMINVDTYSQEEDTLYGNS